MSKKKIATASEIEAQYDSGEYRLAQEKLDFLLPQIRDFVNEKRWLNLRPEYQRRLVWDRKKKSRFIESLLMNVPIPPVFLYEYDLNQYEVMDGQQRLNTVLEFYNNEFKLSGLEAWPSLNGRTYSKCPPRIQRGLDRRRVSATVLLAESASTKDAREMIRRQVFDRLNTGGQPLLPQELRNALYGGPFNKLLIELAGLRLFNEVWGIPPYEDHYRPEDGFISKELAANKYFQRMRDCEIVLRFFAFRRPSRIRGAPKRILDDCMKEHKDAAADVIADYRQRFVRCVTTAQQIFRQRTFKVKHARKWQLSVPLFDAMMVALDRQIDDHDVLVGARKEIVGDLESNFDDPDFYDLIVGRGNTAATIRERIDKIEAILLEHM